jgi:secretion/DNA translocation related TadE-like protein
MARDDRGSAGLLALWVGALVVATAAAGVLWGGAVVARHRAGVAADLAALAAAQALAAGTGDPCRAAARVAATASADVTTCQLLADSSVLVVVRVAAPGGRTGRWDLGMPPARARARAGVPP